MLLAKADWFSASIPIGVAQCRRTYCNHLMLEFLSVHPRVLVGGRSNPRIKGIGSGLVFTLSALAVDCGVERLWGEATEHSAPFYEKAFKLRNIKDLFIVNRDELRLALTGFEQAGGILD